jgi:hypothetical protein
MPDRDGSLVSVPGGRPRRASTPDRAADDAARKAVNALVADSRSDRHGPTAEPSAHLLVAVAAARLAAAAERLARAQVAEARAADGLTWDQVGEAFGTTKQSAHERFRL